MGTLTLAVGTTVDRFGSAIIPSPKFSRFTKSKKEFYVSAADAPYAQLALPPSNLGHDRNKSAAFDYPYSYYVYEVAMPLDVVEGPIRPCFGQPDLGAQLYVGGKGTILALIDTGYLRRVKKSTLHAGGGRTCEESAGGGESVRRGFLRLKVN